MYEISRFRLFGELPVIHFITLSTTDNRQTTIRTHLSMDCKFILTLFVISVSESVVIPNHAQTSSEGLFRIPRSQCPKHTQLMSKMRAVIAWISHDSETHEMMSKKEIAEDRLPTRNS